MRRRVGLTEMGFERYKNMETDTALSDIKYMLNEVRQKESENKTSIDQILIENKCWLCPQMPEPKLIGVQKLNRMNFAYTMLIDHINTKIIEFSDESRFSLNQIEWGLASF